MLRNGIETASSGTAARASMPESSTLAMCLIGGILRRPQAPTFIFGCYVGNATAAPRYHEGYVLCLCCAHYSESLMDNCGRMTRVDKGSTIRLDKRIGRFTITAGARIWIPTILAADRATATALSRFRDGL